MFFIKKHTIKPVQRNFTPAYFLDSATQDFFEENGYVVIKDIINEDELIEARTFFEKIKSLPSYKVDKKFESAGNFECKQTQTLIFEFIKKFMSAVAARFSNTSNCDLGDGGTFFIKPPGKDSVLHPHQDSAVIDETVGYGVFIWIPLCNITMENGPLYVLPKSHLWGNFYRSQHIPWAFRKQYMYLWEKMIPLVVNKGDVICFDTSIIHASSMNKTSEDRISLAGALLPKNHSKVEYLLKDKKFIKYDIDNDYWLDGGKVSTLRNYKYTTGDYNFINPVSKNDIENLLKI